MIARTTENSRSRSQCISAPTTERFLGVIGPGEVTASVGLISSMTLRDDPIYFDIWRPGEATILMDVPAGGFVTGHPLPPGAVRNEVRTAAARSPSPSVAYRRRPASKFEICGSVPGPDPAAASTGQSYPEYGPGWAGRRPPAV